MNRRRDEQRRRLRSLPRFRLPCCRVIACFFLLYVWAVAIWMASTHRRQREEMHGLAPRGGSLGGEGEGEGPYNDQGGCYSIDDDYFASVLDPHSAAVALAAAKAAAAAVAASEPGDHGSGGLVVATFHAGWRLVPQPASFFSGLLDGVLPRPPPRRQRVPFPFTFHNWRRSLHAAGFPPSRVVVLGEDFVWGLDEGANWRGRTKAYLEFAAALPKSTVVVSKREAVCV